MMKDYMRRTPRATAGPGSGKLRQGKIHLLFIPTLVLILVAGIFAPRTATRVHSTPLLNNVLARALDIELGVAHKAKYEQLLSSGTLYTVLEASGALEKRATAVGKRSPALLSRPRTQGCRNVFEGPLLRNIRVNQDCSLRRQAEEVIAVNPTNPKNLVVGANDSRLGFNHCMYAWSFDGGRTWGDQTPPFFEFLLADGHTADACSDPAAAFDVHGNAYIAGTLFNINSPVSAIVVAKSNAGIGGAFYHAPDVTLAFQEFRTDPLGVVASDSDPNIFNEKGLISADTNPRSPKADNVYVTWTRFNLDTVTGVGVNSPIYFSQSTDGGATWSPGVAISGANATFCTSFSGSADPDACDQDQSSHPIVGSDGTIYVSFANFNTPLLGINQTLIVSCPATVDCSVQANWTTPVKIADLIGTQPVGPDPATGCPGGRGCLPPNGYRVSEFTSGSLSVDGNSRLYFVWADFRNGGGSCPPLGSAATATPPCNNDVFYAFSTNGGATWSAALNVTPATQFGPTAQWQPWSAVAPDGRNLSIAYYDRSYGNCEFKGCNDITLARVTHPASAAPTVQYTRVTTSSMPNLVPANNPLQAGFLGDYMWVTVDRTDSATIVWADTRGLDGTVEEDIYFTRVSAGFGPRSQR